MTTTDVYTQLQQVMQQGSEEEARKFIADHFVEFPKDAQEELALAFFEEALEKSVDEEKTIRDFQGQALDAAGQLEKAKRTLEDQSRVQELQEKLKS